MFKIAKKVNSSKSKPLVATTSEIEAKVDDNEASLFLKNINIYILSNGMGKNRVEFFKNALITNGANIMNDESEIDTNNLPNDRIAYIIVVDESTIKTWLNLEKALLKKKFFEPLKIKYSNFFANTPLNIECFEAASFRVVTSLWLSECLKTKSFTYTKKYELRPTLKETNILTILATNDALLKRTVEQAHSSDSDIEEETVLVKKKKINLDTNSSENSYTESDDALTGAKSNYLNEEENVLKKSFIPDSKTWTCAHSSKEQMVNHNKFLTDKLESILSIYETTNEKYRALSYQKAIAALKRCPHQIKTKEVCAKNWS